MENTKGSKLTNNEVHILNSNIGMKWLFAENEINHVKVLNNIKYETKLRKHQVELVKLQAWAIENNKKIVIIFEGRDAAGKGGAIRRITAHINPRYFRIVALDKPTDDERGQWYFQRYVNQLPKPGEIVFFDRSWYNRAIVEPVNGFCSKEEYKIYNDQVNDFEKMIVQSGIYLIKFYFSITKEEQANRFEEIHQSDLKRWKISPVDLKAQELWDEYTKYKKKMLKLSDTKIAPWKIIDADKKTTARIEAIQHILKVIPYKKNK